MLQTIAAPSPHHHHPRCHSFHRLRLRALRPALPQHPVLATRATRCHQHHLSLSERVTPPHHTATPATPRHPWATSHHTRAGRNSRKNEVGRAAPFRRRCSGEEGGGGGGERAGEGAQGGCVGEGHGRGRVGETAEDSAIGSRCEGDSSCERQG